MDQSILIQAFISSNSPDDTARKGAYAYFESIKFTPGLIPVLMNLSVGHEDIRVKQASVIYLKNLTKLWKEPGIEPSDKESLRRSLIQCLSLSMPDLIRSQYEEIAQNVIKFDYPWDDFGLEIKQSISTSNINTIHGGLLMLYQASKKYKVDMSNQRTHLLNLINEFFPVLIAILRELISAVDKEFRCILIVLQIYWNCFYLELPSYHAQPFQLGEWIACFRDVLLMPLGSLETLPVDNPAQREKAPEWLCKKWSIQIILRFFTRYFNKKFLRDQNLVIHEYFQTEWAFEFYKIVISNIIARNQGYIEDSVLNFYIKYISQAVKLDIILKNISFDVIKALLIDISLPLLSRTPKDEELWNSDPIEFIRKEGELSESYYSIKSSAIDLIITLCQRGYFYPFFDYLVKTLQQNFDLLVKERTLLALGCISDIVLKSPKAKSEIEQVLYTLLPDFNHQIGFIRSRIACLFSKYGQIDYKNLPNQYEIFESMCKLMTDPELPVRYTACINLRRILHWGISKSKLPQEINKLLEIFIQLINEIDSEDLVESLQTIIDLFPEEIKPYGLKLCEYLIESFESRKKTSSESPEEVSSTATCTLNTICKIIEMFHDDFDTLYNVSSRIKTLLQFCFSSIGCFEEGANILESLLYYTPAESLPHLYELLDSIITSLVGNDAVKPFSSQYSEEIFPSIANFMSKYTAQTSSNLEFIIKFALKLLKLDEEEIFLGCKTLVVLLECYKGLLDAFLPGILAAVFETFQSNIDKKYKIACTQVVFIAIWNSPVLVASYYEIILSMYQFVCISKKYYSESLAKIHFLYGLGSLFSINLHPELIKILPECFQVMIEACKDDISDNQGINPDASPIHQVDIKLNINNDPDDEESDEYDDFPFGIEPVDYYESKFENLSCIEFIKNLFNTIQNTPNMSSYIFSTLKTEKEGILNIIMTQS
jgi:importin-7